MKIIPDHSDDVELRAAREKFSASPGNIGAAMHLVRLLVKADRTPDALVIARPLASGTQPHMPAAALVLRQAQSLAERRECADVILEFLTKSNAGTDPKSWQSKLLRDALICRTERRDWPRVEPLLVASGWPQQQLTASRLIHEFLCDLAAAVERCTVTLPALWRMTLEPDAPILVAESGDVRVNLAHLRITELSGMSRDLLVPAILWLGDRFGRDVRFDFSTDAIRFGPDKSLVPTARLFVELTTLMGWPIVFPAPARLRFTVDDLPPLDAISDGPILRAGTYELRNVACYLADPEAACNAAVRVARMAQSKDLTCDWKDFASETNAEPDLAIRQLCTNAGWYASAETAAMAYRDWAERYIDAFRGAGIVNVVSNQFPPIAAARGILRTAKIGQFRRQSFEKAVQGRRVVVVSAYAAQIEDNFRSGRLQRLLADIGSSLDIADVATVTPPMSVWPYRPHGNWSESYAALRDDVLRAVDTLKADVVIGACGCYGVPLMAEIARLRPGVAAIYPGQPVNACFGVLTIAAAVHSYWHAAPNSPHWVLGELQSRFPDIVRIDQGRYIGRPVQRAPISF